MDFTDKLDILYARRSSEDGKDGESIENQVALLKQYAADKGYYNLRLSQMTDIQARILTDPAFRKPLLSFSTDVSDALS